MEEKNCRVAETDKRNPGQPLSKVSLTDIDLSKLPPGTRILQEGPPMIIDIPDEELRKLHEAAAKSGRGDDPGKMGPIGNIS